MTAVQPAGPDQGVEVRNGVDPRVRAVFVRSGVFDREWYCSRYPDVLAAGADPVEHYLTDGWREGREPGPWFNSEQYLGQFPPELVPAEPPALHYVLSGWRRGLVPHADFEAPLSASAVPETCPLTVWLAGEAGNQDVGGRWSGRSGAWPDVASRKRDPAVEPPAVKSFTSVAFYLPQFHPIPENDAWWGEGFTEWTNVRRGQPRFPGHEQPRVPGDLGYYDLRDPDVMRRQVDLARRHGVDAFCFYSYWFAGKRLLQGPLDDWLSRPELDLGFCVCWANENWTRTWDGKASEVLLGQSHSAEDDIAFISEMSKYMLDPRYLTVHGRPLFIVYRPDLLPDPAATAQRWRQWCRDAGMGEIVLAYVMSFTRQDPRDFGFDYAIEFPPNNTMPVDITGKTPVEQEFRGTIYDLRELSRRSIVYPRPEFPMWHGACPSWDNEARRPAAGTVLHGGDPELFEEWLVNAGKDALDRFETGPERLVFINAWNEWAEGAYLEPDELHGYEWLHAVRDAQEKVADVRGGTGPGVVVVAHDLYEHGAQMLSLAFLRELRALGRRVEAVALGQGPLAQSFREVAPLHFTDDEDDANCDNLAADLWRRGFRTALCNSSVTGRFAAALRRNHIHVVGLVHELPGVLADPDRAVRARIFPEAVDRLVFPAESVRDRFPWPLPDSANVEVRPQGLYTQVRASLTEGAREGLRRFVGVPADSRLVVGIGYGDHRKGLDLLLDALAAVPVDRGGRPIHVVWAGKIDTADDRIAAAIARFPAKRLHLPGFVRDVGRFLRGADLLVLPSREDPYPSVTLEALAGGRPVVAFRGCTGQDDLIARTGGVLVPEVSPAALAEGLLDALADPATTDTAVMAERISFVRNTYHFRRYVMDLIAGTPAAIPRVSVVLPNYNYGHLIADRIAQIAGQTLAPYELIVLDDASTDDSVERIQAALDAHPHLPARIIVNDANSGSVFRQWSRGVAEAGGDLIWIAEADDIAEPGFLAALTPEFADPEVVISYCESRQIDDGGVVVAPDYRQWTDLGARDYTRRYLTTGSREIAECLAIRNTIPNVSAVVMRPGPLRAALAELPVAELGTAGDWWVYVHMLRNGDIAFNPTVLNSHRRHEASVIAQGLGEGHLREIMAVQEYAATAVDLGDTVRAAARRSTEAIARSLGVAAPPVS